MLHLTGGMIWSRFLIGCSFSFEAAMMNAGISFAQCLEAGCNVPMYRTSIPCTPAGTLYGNMVVSMRPIRHEQVVRAVQVTIALSFRPRSAGAYRRPVRNRYC